MKILKEEIDNALSEHFQNQYRVLGEALNLLFWKDGFANYVDSEDKADFTNAIMFPKEEENYYDGEKSISYELDTEKIFQIVNKLRIKIGLPEIGYEKGYIAKIKKDDKQ